MSNLVQTQKRVVATEVSVKNKEEEKPYLVSYKSINFLVGFVEALLVLRFFFRLAGANPGAGIVSFIYRVTEILMLPFKFVFPTTIEEGAVFEWSVLVAMAIYWLVAYALVHILGIAKTAETGEE